jgi:hypothetical protein
VAFRFPSWGTVRLKKGRPAGYTIPGFWPLFVSRYTNVIVILLSLLYYLKRLITPHLVEGLLVLQTLHLVIKLVFLWKPVYMNDERPIEVLDPPFALAVEHMSFLASVTFLVLQVLHNTYGFLGWVWSLVVLICVAASLYTATNRSSWKRR